MEQIQYYIAIIAVIVIGIFILKKVYIILYLFHSSDGIR